MFWLEGENSIQEKQKLIYYPLAQNSGFISTDFSYRFSAKYRTFATLATENLACQGYIPVIGCFAFRTNNMLVYRCFNFFRSRFMFL